MLIRYVSTETTPSIDREPFPFILNDKCHYPPGPHWVWRSDVTTVKKITSFGKARLGGRVGSEYKDTPVIDRDLSLVTG